MAETDTQPAEADVPPSRSEKPKKSGSVAPRSIRGRIAAGVLIVIPLAVTVFLIHYIYSLFLFVGVRLVYWALKAAHLVYTFEGQPKLIDSANAEFEQKAVAIVLTVLMLYLLGWLGTNVVGKRLIGLFEHLLERIPLVATVYSAIKMMVGALSGSNKATGGQKAVLIDFPHENMKAVALMTNIVTDRTTGKRYATVFVPTTPNPTSGYMELVPIERITYTDWSMEEALSMILSAGAGAKPEVTFTHSPEKPASMRPGADVLGGKKDR